MQNKGGGKIEVKILDLLLEGHDLTNTAKLLNCSIKTVWKYAKIYERENKIIRVRKKPAQYQKPNSILPPLKPGGDFTGKNTIPIMIPHKFGGIFTLYPNEKIPGLQYSDRGKAQVTDRLYSAQLGKYKAQIWLKAGFKGITPDEQIYSGHQSLLAIATSLESKYNIKLNLIKFYNDIEWVDPNKIRSHATAKGAGIESGKGIEVAGALHKYDDKSDIGCIEFNKLPQGDPTKPTDHAKIRDFIYSGKMANTLASMAAMLEKLNDSVISLNQKIEMKNKGV
jgi:hypothetical protein